MIVWGIRHNNEQQCQSDQNTHSMPRDPVVLKIAELVIHNERVIKRPKIVGRLN